MLTTVFAPTRSLEWLSTTRQRSEIDTVWSGHRAAPDRNGSVHHVRSMRNWEKTGLLPWRREDIETGTGETVRGGRSQLPTPSPSGPTIVRDVDDVVVTRRIDDRVVTSEGLLSVGIGPRSTTCRHGGRRKRRDRWGHRPGLRLWPCGRRFRCMLRANRRLVSLRRDQDRSSGVVCRVLERIGIAPGDDTGVWLGTLTRDNVVPSFAKLSHYHLLAILDTKRIRV